jgi:hypothetical protein
MSYIFKNEWSMWQLLVEVKREEGARQREKRCQYYLQAPKDKKHASSDL